MQLQDILKLIRWKNVCFVALTQIVCFIALIHPLLYQKQIKPYLDTVDIVAFILASALLTACGFIINDILDTKIDTINKTDPIIGKRISITQAYRLLYLTFGIGCISTLYVAIKTGFHYSFFIFPVTYILLYIYSKYLKCSILFGNILTAAFLTFVPFICFYAELHPEIKFGDLLHKRSYYHTIALFLFNAFMVNMYREITKDIEDIAGDNACNCRTMPVAWGYLRAKQVARGFLLVFICVSILYAPFEFSISPIYGISFMLFNILIPVMLLVIGHHAVTKESFHRLSTWIKLYLFSGLIYFCIFN